MPKILKMDEAGYNNYLKQIEKLENELADLRMYKGKTAIFQRDTWHDNPHLYQVEAQENSLIKRIKDMKDTLNNIDIISKNSNSNKVDIGDIIELETMYEDEVELMRVKLVGGAANITAEITETSINSPLGDALYQREVNDIIHYTINDSTFESVIKRIIK